MIYWIFFITRLLEIFRISKLCRKDIQCEDDVLGHEGTASCILDFTFRLRQAVTFVLWNKSTVPTGQKAGWEVKCMVLLFLLLPNGDCLL
jgi:hypothetical protein